MERISTYSTFLGLKPHFVDLAKVGYFKVVAKELSPVKQSLHNFYRAVVIFFVVLYNLQHIIRVVQVRHSTDRMVDTLFILLTIVNTLGKQTTFNLRSQRVHKLIAIMNGYIITIFIIFLLFIITFLTKVSKGPYFAPTTDYHVEVLKENAKNMAQVLRLYQAAVLSCGCLWLLFPIVNRVVGVEVEFTGYYPFDTSESPGFELALVYMFFVLTFQAYAHVTMDCTIVAFYNQARCQIRMIRYDLENLVSNINTRTKLPLQGNYVYKDVGSVEVGKRFSKSLRGYEYVIRFTKEVESIFSEAMVVQFFIMAWVICMTMYKIVGLSILSAEFVSMAVYLCCMLAQLFLYCYYGTQLRVESEYINQSIYCSEWISLSPRFRRQLLILMQFCSRPIALRTAYVIPMSLETYISVVRLSYTLFTFLDRK